MRSTKLQTLAALIVAAVVGLAGCSDATSPDGDARLTVALTDAPSDYFQSVSLDVGAVELVPADGPPVTLTDAGGTHELLDLQNGVTAELANQTIEAGTYVQARLILNEVDLTLADGYSLSDGDSELKPMIPSGAQTGIKINLSSADNDSEAGVEIRSGETILVVDFDIEQNFVVEDADPNDGVVDNVLFTPLLRATVSDVAGTVSGTVTSDSDGSGLESETVRATLTDSDLLEELQTDEATATTGSDGSYTIHFLAPGTYDVSVDDFSAAAQSVTVGEAQDVTEIDFSGSSTNS